MVAGHLCDDVGLPVVDSFKKLDKATPSYPCHFITKTSQCKSQNIRIPYGFLQKAIPFSMHNAQPPGIYPAAV
jgi:hypothetical protein